MPEITLGDYTAHLLQELLRAREMADEYSRLIAQRYAEDPVLRFFSVPRYTVPRMELTIPVLVSTARITQIVRFDFPEDEFVGAVTARADDIQATVESFRREREPLSFPPKSGHDPTRVEKLARQLHEDLRDNRDPAHPHGILRRGWAQVFLTRLGEVGLLDFYQGNEPSRALLRTTTTQVIELVLSRTVIGRTELQSLLVDPRTKVVKDGSSPTSTFTVKAEVQEDSFHLRSMRDDETGVVTPVVEYE